MNTNKILLLIKKEIETASDEYDIASSNRRLSEQIYYATKKAVLVDLLEKIKEEGAK